MSDQLKTMSVRLKTVSARGATGEAVVAAVRRRKERIDFDMAAIFAGGWY